MPDHIERRAFMQGAALGALAFTVGGVECLLTPRRRRAAGRAVPTCSMPREAETIEALGETLVPGARAKPASRISSISRSRCRPTKRCSKRGSSMCARLTSISTAPRSAPSTRRAQRSMAVAASRCSASANSATSSTCMRQNKIEGWQGPAGGFVYLLLRSDSVDVVYGTVEGYEALGIPYMPHIAPTGGGDMATHEKVDVVIVGAGASGSSYAAVLAKAGKKVVAARAGPDWQLSDLISSDIWGRRIKPAGAPFLLEGKNPFGYAYQAGWGVGGAALHYFANFPRLLPTDFRMKSEHGRAHDWPIQYEDVAPLLRQGRARHRRVGRCQGGGDLAARGRRLSDAADEDLPSRRDLAQGLRGGRHPHGAGGGRHELDRVQRTRGLHL